MAGAAAGGRGGGSWGPGRGGAGGLRRGCSPPAPAGSPRAGLQPLRATVPFQLQQPHQRRDGGGRAASVPCSVAPEKSVYRPQPPQVRRTFSLDTILTSYLLGQWPRDTDGVFTCCTNDKATQTPLSWQELECEQVSSSAHKRSASWGSTDHRKEITKLKQQLQRTKLSRSGKEKERGSPIQGDHTVRGAVRMSSPSFSSGSPVLRLSPCLHKSLEGLNQELEEVFVKEQGEEELLRILEVPDGHRAPAPLQRGSCDHPLLLLEPGNLASSPSMALASPQPSGQASLEELASFPSDKASSLGHPTFLEDGSPSPVLAFAASPRPNHSYVFKREPPEGCERVRVFEEATSPGPDLAFLTSCPDKNKVHFNPTGSAFCPVSLMKPLFPSMGFIFRNCPSNPGSPLPPASPRAPPRKDPEASKASPLPFEPWQHNPPSEESVLFQSSLVV
ncbi:protein FAM117A isoform X1 [Perognathus longimembris pacificus]|uniref:protein FAM117A isoform X1 n=1 Tax=Perognathus longimembris pacificus TaxID=214514 RepID=UPI00201936CE|nr:protein FAM117A isoform X1 [Perognathus longimembris pacificus]